MGANSSKKTRKEVASGAASVSLKDLKDKAIPHSQSRRLHKITKILRELYSIQKNLPKLIDNASFPDKKLEDYYVQLQIVVEDKRVGRIPVKIDKVFSAVEDLDEAAKILILGIAGVGKSSLLCYICYEWSKENNATETKNRKCNVPSFQQNFEFVFKIRLKLLLDSIFCSELEQYAASDQLFVVILQSLKQDTLEASSSKDVHIEQTLNDINIEDLKSLDKFATLLLVDGFDEIEHLTRIPHVAIHIIESLLSFPNIILTSRPNAVPDYISARFDRKVENIGIGSAGAREFISKHFYWTEEEFKEKIRSYETSHPESTTIDLLKYYFNSTDSTSRDIYVQLQDITRFGGSKSCSTTLLLEHTKRYYENLTEKLLSMYDRNSVLKEVLSIPINAAMVCLISSDPEIMARFEGSFSLAELYNSVIFWLAKRYLVKFEGADPVDVSFEDALDTVELHTLKLIAYHKLIAKEIYIPGIEINATYKSLCNTSNMGRKTDSYFVGLRKVNKLGLLRTISTVVPYEITFWPFGRFENPENEVLEERVYFFVDDINDQLWYAMKIKRKVQIFPVVEEYDRIITWQAIRTIIKQGGTKHPNPTDIEFIETYFMLQGYFVFYKSTKSLSPVELEAQDLLHRKHSFVHLSFQEYLAAENLKILLMSNRKEDIELASNFIAKHRSEPRYLLTLKFLAGLVTQHDPNNNNDPLVERFWEAVLCQVDGKMELNLEANITLLLHLVEQSKIDGVVDRRIPHYAFLLEFISTAVVLNLSVFEESIVASNYVFEGLQKTLLAVLTQDKKWIQSLAETIAESGDLLSGLGKAYLDSFTKPLVSSSTERIQQEQVLLLQKCVKLTMKLITSNRWREQNEDGTTIDLSIIFINLPSDSNWLVKRTGIMAIAELSSIKGEVISEDKSISIINFLMWEVTNSNLCKTIFDLFSALLKTHGKSNLIDTTVKIGILKQIDIYEKRLKLNELDEIVQSMPQSLDVDLKSLLEQLSSSFWFQRYLSIVRLENYFSENPGLISSHVIDIMIDRSLDLDTFVRDSVGKIFEKILVWKPSVFDEKHVNKLVERVIKPDQFHIIAEKARAVLIKIVRVRPDLARIEEWIDSLSDHLSSGGGHYFQTKSFLQISTAALTTNPAIVTSAVIDQSISLLRSDEADSFSSIRMAAADLLSAVAKRDDNHIFPFEFMKENLQKSVESASKAGALAFWSQLCKEDPSHLDESLVSLVTLLIDDSNSNVQKLSKIALGTFIDLKPECVQEIRFISYSAWVVTLSFKLQFVWGNTEFTLDSQNALEWALSHRPQFVQDYVLPKLLSLLCPSTLGDGYSSQKSNCSAAAIVLCRYKKSIVLSDEQAAEILDSMMAKLNVQQYSLDEHSQSVIAAITELKPHLITENILHSLAGMRYEKTENDYLRMKENTEAIASIARLCPHLFSSTYILALVARLSQSCLTADKLLANVFHELVLTRPELFHMEGVMESLVDATKASPAFKDSNGMESLRKVCPLLVQMQRPGLCKMVFDVLSNGSNKEKHPVTTKGWEHVIRAESNVLPASTLFQLVYDTIGLRKREVKKVQRATVEIEYLSSQIGIDSVISNLKNRDSQAREDALSTLEKRIKQDPTVITSFLVDALLDRFQDVGFGINDKAGSLLGIISSLKPSIIPIDILHSLVNSDKYGVSQSTIKAWGYIARANGSLLDNQIINALEEKLSNKESSKEVISAVAWTLEAIASTRGELITDQIVNELGGHLYHNSRLVRQHVVDALREMLILQHVGLDGYTIRQITLLVRDSEWQVRVAAVRFLHMLAISSGDVSKSSIQSLINKVGDPEIEVREVLIETLGVIVRTCPYPFIVEELVAKFHFENPKRILEEDRVEIVRQTAAAAVGEVIHNCPSLATPHALQELLKLLYSGDSAIQSAAMDAVGKILGCRHEFIQADVIATVCNYFADKNSSVATMARKALMTAAVSISPVILETLTHASSDVRAAVIESLTREISNPSKWSRLRVDALLKIVGFHDVKDPEREDLIDTARRVLDAKASTLSAEEKADLVTHFETMMGLSYESKPFIGKVCKRILLSNQYFQESERKGLSAVDRQFVLCAIQHGLGLTFTPQSISFGDATYICNESDSPFLRDCIQQALRLAERNVLASQYAHWRPMFPNSGQWLGIAASEIALLPSIVNTDSAILDMSSVDIHFMVLSNHRQDKPKAIFLLAERREYFGYHAIDKYPLKEHDDAMVLDLSMYEKWMLHPHEVNAFRKNIFGAMEYLADKPRYFSKTCHLDGTMATAFLQNILTANPDMTSTVFSRISELFHLGGTFQYRSFYRFATERKKCDLLRLKEVEGEAAGTRTRKESIEIDNMDRLNGVIEEVQEMKEAMSSPVSLFHAMTGESRKVEEEIRVLKESLVQLSNNQNEQREQILQRLATHDQELMKLTELTNDFETILSRCDQYEATISTVQQQLHEQLLNKTQIQQDLRDYHTKCQQLEAAIHSCETHLRQTNHTVADENELWQLQRDLAHLKADAAERQYALEQLTSTFVPVMSLLRSRLEEKQWEDTALPEDHPHRCFYRTFVQQLSAVYFASAVVQTEIVSSQKRGVTGNIGQLLSLAGGYVPIFGLAVQFCGNLLSAVDRVQQERMIQRLYSFAGPPNDIEQIAKYVARCLLDKEEELDVEHLLAPATFRQTMEKLLGITAMDVDEFIQSLLTSTSSSSSVGQQKCPPLNDVTAQILATIAIGVMYQGDWYGSQETFDDERKAKALFQRVFDEYALVTSVTQEQAMLVAQEVLTMGHSNLVLKQGIKYERRRQVFLQSLRDILSRPTFRIFISPDQMGFTTTLSEQFQKQLVDAFWQDETVFKRSSVEKQFTIREQIDGMGHSKFVGQMRTIAHRVAQDVLGHSIA